MIWLLVCDRGQRADRQDSPRAPHGAQCRRHEGVNHGCPALCAPSFFLAAPPLSIPSRGRHPQSPGGGPSVLRVPAAPSWRTACGWVGRVPLDPPAATRRVPPDRGSPMPRPLRDRSQAGRARRVGGWRPPSTFPSAATTTSPPDKSPRKQPHPPQPTSTPLSVAIREPVTYGFLHAETLRGATGVPPREGRRHSPAVHTPPLSVSRMAAGRLPHGGEAHLHPGPVVSVWVRQPAEGGDSRPTPTPHLAGAPRRGSTTNTRVCVCAKPRPPPFPLRRVVEHLLRVVEECCPCPRSPHSPSVPLSSVYHTSCVRARSLWRCWWAPLPYTVLTLTSLRCGSNCSFAAATAVAAAFTHPPHPPCSPLPPSPRMHDSRPCRPAGRPPSASPPRLAPPPLPPIPPPLPHCRWRPASTTAPAPPGRRPIPNPLARGASSRRAARPHRPTRRASPTHPQLTLQRSRPRTTTTTQTTHPAAAAAATPWSTACAGRACAT